MSYIVKLHFTGADKEYPILREGFSLCDLVGAKGRHTTQNSTIRIKSHEASTLFLQEGARFIKAEIISRTGNIDTILFAGVVRPYQSVSAKNNTEENFNFEIMDFTEVMDATNLTESEDFVDKTLDWCVQYLYNKCTGLPSLVIPQEFSTIDLAYFNVDADRYKTVKEELEAILWEYGYDFKFGSTSCQIIPTTIASATGLSSVSVKNTLRVQRADNWSDGVIVKYGVAKVLRSYPLKSYELEAPTLSWLENLSPYLVKHVSGTKTVKLSWDFKNETYGLFNNYVLDKDFSSESTLLVQNVKVKSSSGCTVTNIDYNSKEGTITFNYDCDFVFMFGGEVMNLYGFDLVGDVMYALAGEQESNSNPRGDKPEEITLHFVRDPELAQDIAEREYKRAKVAAYTYTCNTLQNYSAGSFVKIIDSVIGLNAVVRVLSCNKNTDGIYTLKCESADYLSISVSIQDKKVMAFQDGKLSLDLNLTDTITEQKDITATVQGSLLENIITQEATALFVPKWYLNGTYMSTWNGYAHIVRYADLVEGDNLITLQLIYDGNVAAEASNKVVKIVSAEGATITQYAVGNASEVEEMTFGYASDNDYGYANEFVYGFSPWQDEPIAPEDIPVGMFLWMRISTDYGRTWKYVRLTENRKPEAKYDGVVSNAVELALITDKNVGDYFLAGGSWDTYVSGNPYVWNGSAWGVLTLNTNATVDEYANIMSHCINDALTVDSVQNTKFFSFFNNLGVNTAFIKNLIARNVFVQDSDQKFSVTIQNYDSSGNFAPKFTVSYDGINMFDINPLTGTTTMVNADLNNADMEAVVIRSGQFNGQIDCPSFSSMRGESATVLASVTVSGSAQSQFNAINGVSAFKTESFKRCTSTDNSGVAYVKYYTTSGAWNYTNHFEFYNSSFTYIGEIRRNGSGAALDPYSYYSYWANQTNTFSIYSGGSDLFKFKNIPNYTDLENLQSGQVYEDANHFLKIKP